MSIKQAFSNSFRVLNQGINQAGREFVRTLGASGTQIYGGQISDEDYGLRGRITKMKNWDDPAERADMVDEMITDATIEGMRNAIELPIRSAPLTIEPVGGKRALNVDQQIADALEEDLLRNPNFSIRDNLRHWLTALWYGNVVMVKTFERPEGLNRTRWGGWYYRKQRTLDQWDVSEMGRLQRVHQRTVTPLGQTVDVWIPEKVPASGMESPLFHFSYKQLGDNFNGVSLLRQAFAPWFIKRHLLVNIGIQSDVAAVGIPMINYKDGIPPNGSEERNAVQNFARNLHSIAQNYGEVPPGIEVGVFGGDQRFGFDLSNYIHLLDQQIVKSILGLFLEQPTSSLGSKAMQTVNMSMFLDSMEAISNDLEMVLNEGWRGTQNVKQYVNLNWPNVTEYPKVRIAQINTQSLESFMPAIETYIGAGGPMTPEDWNQVRERLGMSEMEEKEFKEEIERKVKEPKEEDMN